MNRKKIQDGASFKIEARFYFEMMWKIVFSILKAELCEDAERSEESLYWKTFLVTFISNPFEFVPGAFGFQSAAL